MSDSLNEMVIHSNFAAKLWNLKGHVFFTAIVITKVFISLQRDVTTVETSDTFGPNAEVRSVAEQKNTEGTVTWVLFTTTSTALSEI